MAGKDEVPPRPIAPGEVVTGFSEALGEWTAGQIIALDPVNRTADVLHLDWSGPEPRSLADLGEVRPLRLTHHSWTGNPEQCHYEWVLPRGFRVLGVLPLLSTQSRSYSGGWPLGTQLARQRHWDAGHRDDWVYPHQLSCGADEIEAKASPDIRSLSVVVPESLDCEAVVKAFPAVVSLGLSGEFGTLTAAGALNELRALKRISIQGLFGMSKEDILRPAALPHLESLRLDDIPADYATATRAAWRREIPQGVYVDITGARKPEWIAENLGNPLRDWADRSHIGAARAKKAVARFKLTRRAVHAALAEGAEPARLAEIGREYGEAFNELDRKPFIETIEREELIDALDQIVTDAEETLGGDFAWARVSLEEGVEAVRDW